MTGRTIFRTSWLFVLPSVLVVAGSVLVAGVGKGAPKSTDAKSASAADVNRRNADGSTPLQWAVYDGDASEVKRLLGAGADVSLPNNYGATPMSLAAEVADTAILKLLLEAGANADSPNQDGQTALLTVARTGNVDAAKLLLDHGATIDAREGFGGQTALMWAAARRHPEMIELLLARGAGANLASTNRDYQRHVTAEGRPKSLDSGGLTALLYAARENCIACVDALLKGGADIDLPDPDGVSPLNVAIMNANWDLAKKLVDAGADVNQWDIYGEAALYNAVGFVARADGGRASIDPPNATKGMDVVRLLLDKGADPNMQLFFRPANVRGSTNGRGSTALIRAANSLDKPMVKLLLEHGADATLYTGDRQTPIHAVLAGGGGAAIALSNGAAAPGRGREDDAIELIKMFHDAGTDVNVVALVNHIEEVRGGSALHYAVRKRYKEVIKLLASYKIDMNLKDQDGLTALDYTQSRGFMPFMALQTPIFKDEAALLRELGATVLMPKDPVWPVLGPPQGMWPDIWPLGEPVAHEPIYQHKKLAD
ncbi:MAG TPA: ankyrin repeat domain-containing protein [Gammaproteobacteria bacterium]|nr:ankyrin repeat domain-containing protein [Gammaproteobacteria bacterium]